MSGWGEPVEVPEGQRVRWDVGTRAVWARRLVGQCLLGVVETGDDARQDLTHDVGEWSEDVDGRPQTRVAVRGAGPLRLLPAPPTRSLLARPELPLSVPAGESAQVYVGVPLWGRVLVGDLEVLDQGLVRLSDTWFGTPLEGELCFATRTHLSMDRDSVGRKAFRAVCSVQIINRGDDPLPLERVRIPGPALALWADQQGGLCTSTVRVVRSAGLGLEEVVVDAKPPAEAVGAAIVGQAREAGDTPRLVRALSAVWKGMGGNL